MTSLHFLEDYRVFEIIHTYLNPPHISSSFIEIQWVGVIDLPEPD